jgi:hypothetical protein
MLRKIFTKTFFELTDSDQAAVVQSIIHDLKSCIELHVNPEDDTKVEKRIRRIWARAVRHGVVEDDVWQNTGGRTADENSIICRKNRQTLLY